MTTVQRAAQYSAQLYCHSWSVSIAKISTDTSKIQSLAIGKEKL